MKLYRLILIAYLSVFNFSDSYAGSSANLTIENNTDATLQIFYQIGDERDIRVGFNDGEVSEVTTIQPGETIKLPDYLPYGRRKVYLHTPDVRPPRTATREFIVLGGEAYEWVVFNSTFGASFMSDIPDPFKGNGWTFVGEVDRFCNAELTCNNAVPVCDPSRGVNAGLVIQDRRRHNGCVAQGCEDGRQMTSRTYSCGDSSDPLVAKGWTPLGTLDRFCSAELACGGVIPECNSANNGKVIQDRRAHNGCFAQGCEGVKRQLSNKTYECKIH